MSGIRRPSSTCAGTLSSGATGSWTFSTFFRTGASTTTVAFGAHEGSSKANPNAVHVKYFVIPILRMTQNRATAKKSLLPLPAQE